MKRPLLALAALMAVTVLSSSASAATSTVTTSDNDPLTRTITSTPKAVLLPTSDLNGLDIALSCTATATPDPLETSILSCYLKGTGSFGGTFSAPTTVDSAAVATAAGVLRHLPPQTYVPCMSARAIFSGGAIADTGTVCG